MSKRLIETIILLCVCVTAAPACNTENPKMTNTTQVKSAEEIQLLAARRASTLLPIEVAKTIPVPVRHNRGFAIQVLYYRQVKRSGQKQVSLPHHCMLLDPESGSIIRFWACTSAELGLADELPEINGAGIQADMPFDEFMEKRERFVEISADVWKAYFRDEDVVDEPTKLLVCEYRQLFLVTTDAKVAAFMVAAADDFFGWLDKVCK